MIPHMIKTIVFDIGNVMMRFDWHAYVNARYDGDTVNAVNESLWFTGYWNELDRGVFPEEEIFRMMREHRPSYSEQITDACENVAECMHNCDYAVPWVKELKNRGYRVLYLSNYSGFLIRRCPEVLDFLPYTDGGVFSYKVKHVKPEPDIYMILLETYGLKAEECVFIDDNINNIDAANHLGFNTIHFTEYETVYRKLNDLLERKGIYR